MSSGQLSIIIPALNEQAAIADTLMSLEPLRARGNEVIVVDGGSQDRTRELAAPLADLVLSAERGRARQMNAGAKRARHDVLLFLHADSRLPPRADELISAGLRRGHRWGRFDVRMSKPHWALQLVAFMMNWRSRLSGIATGDQAIFLERNLFQALGGYADIELMEDIELSRRLKKCGRPLCLRAAVTTSSRRWEKHGVWRTIVLMWRLRLAYFLGANPARLARRYD